MAVLTVMAHFPWATPTSSTHEFTELGQSPMNSSSQLDDRSTTPYSNQNSPFLIDLEYEQSLTGYASTPSQSESNYLEIQNPPSGQSFTSPFNNAIGPAETLFSRSDQWLDDELLITPNGELEGDFEFRYQSAAPSAQNQSNHIGSIIHPSGLPLINNHKAANASSCSASSTLSIGYSPNSSGLECKWNGCSNTEPFLDKSLLTRHVRSKHIVSNSNELKCNWHGCAFSKRFSRQQTLVRHVETTHISPRQYKCPHPACNKEFGRKDRLHLHLRIFHPHLLEVCKCESKRCDHYHARRR